MLVNCLLSESRLIAGLQACPCGSHVLEPADEEGVLFRLEEEFEDHKHHVLFIFELTAQDLRFFFVNTAVRMHFIKNLLVSLDLLFDRLVKDGTVEALDVAVNLAVRFC